MHGVPATARRFSSVRTPSSRFVPLACVNRVRYQDQGVYVALGSHSGTNGTFDAGGCYAIKGSRASPSRACSTTSRGCFGRHSRACGSHSPGSPGTRLRKHVVWPERQLRLPGRVELPAGWYYVLYGLLPLLRVRMTWGGPPRGAPPSWSATESTLCRIKRVPSYG